MANEIEMNDKHLEAKPQGEPEALKISFADVMGKPKDGGDPLIKALDTNEADIKATMNRIAEIFRKAEIVHPGGAKGFEADHVRATSA